MPVQTILLQARGPSAPERTSPVWKFISRTSRAAVALLLAFGISAASHAATSPLISPPELKKLIDRRAVRVLDTRELLQSDNKTPNFSAGHIPSAVATPYSAIRGPASNPGQLISEEKFSRLASQWGLRPDDHIVFVGTGGDATDFGTTARFYWTFKLAGFTRLSILEGGLGAWMALGYPVSTQSAKVEKTSLKLRFDHAQVATQDGIAKALASNTKPLLIDARPEEYFKGTDRHPQAARAGTLPGAVHLDQEEFFQLNTGKLLSRNELAKIVSDAQIGPRGEAIAFCNAGHWSATTWFVMSEILGMTNVRMYPESAVGWSKSRFAMDNEPKRLNVLKKELKDAITNLKY